MSKRNTKRNKNNNNNLTQNILTILRKQNSNPINYKQIAASLGVRDTSTRNLIIKRLKKLQLEDKIEDITGIDVELDSVVDDVVAAAENVVDEVHDTVVDSLESGDSLEEVVSDAKTAGEEAIDNVDIDVDAIKSLTVAALKERLKAAGLPVSGKKAELVERLLTAGV